MSHDIRIERSAQKGISALHPDALRRIDEHVRALANDPRPPGVKALKGRRRGLWRLRVGEYRIVYHIDDRAGVVSIVAVGPRGSVYA